MGVVGFGSAIEKAKKKLMSSNQELTEEAVIKEAIEIIEASRLNSLKEQQSERFEDSKLREEWGFEGKTPEEQRELDIKKQKGLLEGTDKLG